MIKIKKFSYLILLFLTAFIISGFKGCSLTKDRPVLKVPDANQDRMLKEVFTGTKNKPKYWISKVTKVYTTFDTSFPGWHTTAVVGYFEFSRDKLSYYNAVTRQFLEKPETAIQGSPELIHQWDIDHSEFRLKEIDGYTTNTEEENKYTTWDKKRYFTVDWSDEDITMPTGNLPKNSSCWKKQTSSVIDSSREITEDYISFVVAVDYQLKPKCQRGFYGRHIKTTYSEQYRYSFKRVADPRLKDDSYTPYVYHGEEDPLHQKYGYFNTIRTSIAKDNINKNIFYMNRWNPNKKHVFHFGEHYPEDYKYLGHGIICATNKLFAKHGLNDYKGECKTDGSEHEECLKLKGGKYKKCVAKLPSSNVACSKGICFEVKENTGQKMGDIRYSFFHILNSNQTFFGFGPLDAHPATGEIISGNVHINFSLIDRAIKYRIDEFFKRDNLTYCNKKGSTVENPYKATKYDTSFLFRNMKQLLQEEDPKKWTEKTSKKISADSDYRLSFEHLVSELTYKRWSEFTSVFKTKETTDVFKIDAIIETLTQYKDTLNQQEATKNIEDTIETLKNLDKKNTQDDYETITISEDHATTLYPADPVIAPIQSFLADCRDPEELKKILLFDLFAHEFGHVLNLRHNFYGSFDSSHWHDDLESSSVMDYLTLKQKAKTDSKGKAIFGSYDEAALVYAYSDGKKDLAKENNTSYLYCAEEHVFSNFLCNRWDHGQTISEVMMSFIETYEEDYFVRNFRLDRAYWRPGRSYIYYIFRKMFYIKQVLPMWLTAFNADNFSSILGRQSNKNYTNEEIITISKTVEKDIKQAIKLSMAFYSSVIQMPETERPWLNIFNADTGALEVLGIFLISF